VLRDAADLLHDLLGRVVVREPDDERQVRHGRQWLSGLHDNRSHLQRDGVRLHRRTLRLRRKLRRRQRPRALRERRRHVPGLHRGHVQGPDLPGRELRDDRCAAQDRVSRRTLRQERQLLHGLPRRWQQLPDGRSEQPVRQERAGLHELHELVLQQHLLHEPGGLRQRELPAVRGALVCLVLAACSSETGIVVAVSGSSVDELAFQVGVSDGADYVLDASASGQTRDVRGRDLRLDPYELLLREGDESKPVAMTVRVLVLGARGGKQVSFALLEPPQAFVRGEVLRRALLLQETAADAGKLGKCYQARVAQKSYRLIAADDRDCDGVSPAEGDCADADAAVRPGAKEICDGKDNDCDPKTQFVGSEICYATAGSRCHQGLRSCDESKGQGKLGPCSADESGPLAAEAYCRAQKSCESAPSPAECVAGKVTPVLFGCKAVVHESKLCGGSATVELGGTPPPSCVWALISDGGWPLALAGAGCKASLTVAGGGAPPATGTAVIELVTGTDTSRVARVAIEASPATSCGDTPFACYKTK
jgi:hypothetical protein